MYRKKTAKMGMQGNMPQMKEQDKFPEKELNEMPANNLKHTQFKKMVIKMFRELEYSNSMKKDI